MSEGSLYFIELIIKSGAAPGLDLPNFLTKVAALLGGYSNATKVIHRFKVSGEPRVIAIFRVFNMLGLERTVAGLSRMGIFDVNCIPLIPYENFAASLGGVDPTLTATSPNDLSEKNMYMLEFNVEYQGKSTEQLVEIWRKQAESLLSARVYNGMKVDAFKVVASRIVYCFLSVSSPEELDKMSFSLPLMAQNGNSVNIKCRAVQALDDYIARIMTESL